MITNQRATRADRSDLAMSLRLYLDAEAAYNWALVNCVNSGSDLGEIEASRIITELRALRDVRYDLHRRRLTRVNGLLSAAVDSGST
jgi:hypothetical protein